MCVCFISRVEVLRVMYVRAAAAVAADTAVVSTGGSLEPPRHDRGIVRTTVDDWLSRIHGKLVPSCWIPNPYFGLAPLLRWWKKS